MTELKKEYKNFMDDIQKNIKDKEDLEYVQERFAKFLDVVLDEMDRILDYKEEQMNELEQMQKEINKKFTQIQKTVTLKRSQFFVIRNIRKRQPCRCTVYVRAEESNHLLVAFDLRSDNASWLFPASFYNAQSHADSTPAPLP